MRVIVPIVEGPGDVEALPIILRRVLGETLSLWDIHVISGMKLGRGHITDATSLKRHLRLASLTPNCALIVVFADRDDDDCVELTRHVKSCANEEGFADLVEPLIINREYETWLLAGIKSLRGARGISEVASPPATLQHIRDPKKRISDVMSGSRVYSETADQAALSSSVDLNQISQRCGCFRKMVSKLRRHLIDCE